MGKKTILKISVALFCLALFTLFFYFNQEQQAQAACGASLSSCKSCHEVKGQKPVANSGAWHSSHAFGDFCEFCHGGVVSSMDKAKAHQGLKEPFADVKASCGSCHVNDLEERAKAYGASVTAGGSGGKPTQGGSSQVAKLELIPAEQVPEQDLIDYNRELAIYQGLEQNKGNVILIVLNMAMLLVLLFLIWKFDLQRIVFASREITAARKESGAAGLDKFSLSYAELDAMDSILARPGGEQVLAKFTGQGKEGDKQ